MTSVYERATRSIEEPVAEANPPMLVIEMAASMVELMLNRAPLSPSTTEKYLKQLAEILASARPELDVRRAAQTIERSEIPSTRTMKELDRDIRRRKKTEAVQAEAKSLPVVGASLKRKAKPTLSSIFGTTFEGRDLGGLTLGGRQR